ncbi:MAG: hypothetical protein HUU35_18350, partial [Armatimonadetes bacterium]|nr:hypothetical protein [Armatimonadota bacterium]
GVAEPGAEEVALSYLAPLTRDRGALLAITPAGDERRLLDCAQTLAAEQPLDPRATVVVAVGDLGDWAADVVLRQATGFSGLVLLDAPLNVPPRGNGRPGLQTCLLVAEQGRAAAAERLAERLRLQDMPAAVQRLGKAEVASYLGASLTHLLPPPPPRLTLRDPTTGASLSAPEGWEFVRDDFFLALARPRGGQGPTRIEIASGRLGERSYQDYFQATLKSLRIDGITLHESAELGVTGAAARTYHFTDRRAGRTRSVYWVQVATEDRLVSLRGVLPEADRELLAAVRALAASIRFESP